MDAEKFIEDIEGGYKDLDSAMDDFEHEHYMEHEHAYLNNTEEPWYNWRSLAGYVYISICVFDFLIMPATMQANHEDIKEYVTELMYTHEDKKFVLEVVDRVNAGQWKPVTLVGGGLFHISFGAILTGAAVSRGRERTEMVKHNGRQRK